MNPARGVRDQEDPPRSTLEAPAARRDLLTHHLTLPIINFNVATTQRNVRAVTPSRVAQSNSQTDRQTDSRTEKQLPSGVGRLTSADGQTNRADFSGAGDSPVNCSQMKIVK